MLLELGHSCLGYVGHDFQIPHQSTLAGRAAQQCSALLSRQDRRRHRRSATGGSSVFAPARPRRDYSNAGRMPSRADRRSARSLARRGRLAGCCQGFPRCAASRASAAIMAVLCCGGTRPGCGRAASEIRVRCRGVAGGAPARGFPQHSLLNSSARGVKTLRPTACPSQRMFSVSLLRWNAHAG